MEVLQLKSITSFSLDTVLKGNFYKKIPSTQRTKLIELFIKQFLEKKSPERVSILSLAMSKPSLAKEEVSD